MCIVPCVMRSLSVTPRLHGSLHVLTRMQTLRLLCTWSARRSAARSRLASIRSAGGPARVRSASVRAVLRFRPSAVNVRAVSAPLRSRPSVLRALFHKGEIANATHCRANLRFLPCTLHVKNALFALYASRKKTVNMRKRQ